MDEFNKREQLELSLALRLSMIQKEGLPNLSFDQLKYALMTLKWKQGIPNRLHDIIHDVFSIEVSEIVAVLSNKAIRDGYKAELEEYASLFK